MTVRVEEEMRALSRAFDDFQRLRQEAPALELPELDLVAVKSATEVIILDEAAYDRVRQTFSRDDVEGWCRFRSVVVWSQSPDWPSFEEAGPPVFAEWAESTDQSCRLRLVSGAGPAKARIWTYGERALRVGEGLEDGEFCALAETRKALARAAPKGVVSLAYHAFWGPDPHDDAHALRRRFDRFAGFEED